MHIYSLFKMKIQLKSANTSVAVGKKFKMTKIAPANCTKIQNFKFHRLKKRVSLTFSALRALKIKTEALGYVFYITRKQILLILSCLIVFLSKEVKMVYWLLEVT